MSKADIKAYLSKIGAKGGKARARNPDRLALAHAAARASWSKEARAKRLSKRNAKR